MYSVDTCFVNFPTAFPTVIIALITTIAEINTSFSKCFSTTSDKISDTFNLIFWNGKPILSPIFLLSLPLSVNNFGGCISVEKFRPCHNLIHLYKKPREFYVSTNFVTECICSLALAYSIDNLCISVVAHFFSILIFPSQVDSFICCSSYKYSATRNVKTSLPVDNFSLMLITRLLHCVSK